ncbi:MAG: class I SAM-dependent methyltransferase [Halioglobus sp.]
MSFSREKNYSRSDVYLKQDYTKPKKMFVDIGSIIEDHSNTSTFRLLDVGAATGAFIDYTQSRFPNAETLGVEFDSTLVESAQSAHKPIIQGDANNLDGIDSDSFDFVTMTGTHSIFDNFEPAFSECIRVCRPNGLVIVTGIFNDYPVDVQIHWRYPENENADWHPGYNLFSKESVSKYLLRNTKVTKKKFKKFYLDFELPQQEDPIRSWTYQKGDEGFRLRNGIMPLNFEILKISL